MNTVEVSELSKNYPSFVLSALSFDVRKNRITGFIGRNGAGKSTTISGLDVFADSSSTHPTLKGMLVCGLDVSGKKQIIISWSNYE